MFFCTRLWSGTIYTTDLSARQFLPRLLCSDQSYSMKIVRSVESCFPTWCSFFAVLLQSFVQISLSFDEVFVPPKFPDIFSSFSESLSASDSLRSLVLNLAKDSRSCSCGEATRVNLTEFNANLGSQAFSNVIEHCASLSDKNAPNDPDVAAVSRGQMDENRPLVIGLSASAAVIIIVVIGIFLARKKNQCIRVAWSAAKGKPSKLDRQTVEYLPALPSKRQQTVVSVTDDLTSSHTSWVSRIGGSGLCGKARAILLPTRNETHESHSKSENIMPECHTNQSENK